MACSSRGDNSSIVVVPANHVSWADLTLVLGRARCYESPCFCQRFKIPGAQWRMTDEQERAHLLRAQTDCGHPESGKTSGLMAFLGDEPVGWCAVEPRSRYFKLRTSRIPWADRHEDKDDSSVWAVTCFVVRPGWRRRGTTYVLARTAVDFAREQGARAIEGYPMITQPGQEIAWGELHVGSLNVFVAAGFREISRPTSRRVVMRRDLA